MDVQTANWRSRGELVALGWILGRFLELRLSYFAPKGSMTNRRAASRHEILRPRYAGSVVWPRSPGHSIGTVAPNDSAYGWTAPTSSG